MTEQLATLCYILQGDHLLLIRKKRGIGAGKINGPGGKVDPGETPLAAAIRETQEETGLTPLDPQLYGDLRFHFADGLRLRCLVYLAKAHHGRLTATAEATPMWVHINALPYDEMWEDDRVWLPLLLAGQRFAGSVGVQDEHVTEQNIRVISNEINVS